MDDSSFRKLMDRARAQELLCLDRLTQEEVSVINAIIARSVQREEKLKQQRNATPLTPIDKKKPPQGND